NSSLSVTVVAGKVTDISIPLEPTVKIESRVVDAVTGKGVPKVTVLVHPQSNANTQQVMQGWIESDDEGRIVAYGPANLTYALSVYSGQRPKGYIFPNQGQGGLFPPIKIELGKSHTFPDIKLSKSTHLDFEIVDSKNAPLPKAILHPAGMWESSV